MITIQPAQVTAILLASAGWINVTPGSFKIDGLQLIPPPAEAPEAEDYGFVCVDDAGAQISGRLSVLLATKRTNR